MDQKIIESLLSRKASIERTGKHFFIDVPEDIEINHKSSNYNDWSNWRKSNYNFFKSELPVRNDQLIAFDIGAGPSQFRDLFQNYTTIGVDYYPYEMVHVITDLNQPLPLRSDSADLIILSNVIEHIPDTAALLNECHRVLKPGGKILATIPFLMREHQKPYDFNRYTHYGLESKFSKFKNVNVVPLGDPFDVYDSIQRQFWRHYAKQTFSLKVFYILERILLKLAKRVVRSNGSSEEFTEGYGVTAYK